MTTQRTFAALAAASLLLSIALEVFTTGFPGARDPSVRSVLVRAVAYALVPAVLGLMADRVARAATGRPWAGLPWLLWGAWGLFAGLSALGLLSG